MWSASSSDGRWWWEDRLRRWFPVTDQEDELEIEAENYAETSLFNRLWSGSFTYWGSPSYFRFVGRGEHWWSRRYRRPVAHLIDIGSAQAATPAVR